MKPKDILLNAIEESMLKELEDLGFKFYKSSVKFIRVVGDYTQEILFSTNKWNQEGTCEFHTIINVRSRRIRKFVKDITGDYPPHNIIFSIYDWHNKDFSQFSGGWYELTESNYTNQMAKYVEKFIDVLVPVINFFSDYKRCLDRMVERNHFDMGIYLAELIGDRTSSKKLIEYVYSRASDKNNLNKTRDMKKAQFLNDKFHII
ncbi:MAG: hypothetical protein AB7E61_06025 [Acholeplasmataceae bacterium]